MKSKRNGSTADQYYSLGLRAYMRGDEETAATLAILSFSERTRSVDTPVQADDVHPDISDTVMENADELEQQLPTMHDDDATTTVEPEVASVTQALKRAGIAAKVTRLKDGSLAVAKATPSKPSLRDRMLTEAIIAEAEGNAEKAKKLMTAAKVL
jgi:hypothetical protein